MGTNGNGTGDGAGTWAANVQFLLVAILLPNLVPFGAILAGIGTPVRAGAIFGYAVVAVMARVYGARVAIPALLFLVTFDVANSISLLFGLAILPLLRAARYIVTLNIHSSPLYVGLGLTLVATTALTARLILRNRDQLCRASLAPMLAVLAVLVPFDMTYNASPHYLFGSAFAMGHPFRSAMLESDVGATIRAAAGAGESSPAEGHASDSRGADRILVVIVEGWGRLVSDALQERIEQPLRDPALASRHTVTFGTTEYFGSTTASELREFCGSRLHYDHFAAGESSPVDCLPAMLARRGYETLSFHAFTDEMFERSTWYPAVGFQRSMFALDLITPTSRLCGAVFRGLCDSDIAPRVADALRPSNTPRLVYWLTLNSHIPVTPGEFTPRFGCAGQGGAFGREDVCWMAEAWSDVLQSVADIARDPCLAPTAILVVGDHAPPLWSRAGRNMFRAGEVSWASLVPRPDAPTGACGNVLPPPG